MDLRGQAWGPRLSFSAWLCSHSSSDRFALWDFRDAFRLYPILPSCLQELIKLHTPLPPAGGFSVLPPRAPSFSWGSRMTHQTLGGIRMLCGSCCFHALHNPSHLHSQLLCHLSWQETFPFLMCDHQTLQCFECLGYWLFLYRAKAPLSRVWWSPGAGQRGSLLFTSKIWHTPVLASPRTFLWILFPELWPFPVARYILGERPHAVFEELTPSCRVGERQSPTMPNS